MVRQLVDAAYSFRDRIEQHYRSQLRSGRAKRDYLVVLSDILNFASLLESLAKKAQCIGEAHKVGRSDRLCHRWLYSEHDNIVSLTKLEPSLTISAQADGSLSISFKNTSLKIRGTVLDLKYNDAVFRVDARDENEVLNHRGVFVNVIGRLKAVLDHHGQDFDRCIRELRIVCSNV